MRRHYNVQIRPLETKRARAKLCCKVDIIDDMLPQLFFCFLLGINSSYSSYYNYNLKISPKTWQILGP